MEEGNINNILFTIYQNGIQMLKDRGYDIPKPVDNLAKNYIDFTRFYGDSWVMANVKTKTPEPKMAYLYVSVSENGIKKDELSDVITSISKIVRDKGNDIKQVTIIIVASKEPEKAMKAEIDRFSRENEFTIEIMQRWELMFNPTVHEYVPKHVLLNNQEVAELLGANIFSRKDMETLSVADRISRWYGAKHDDIFKINRNIETAGKEVIYKRVVRISEL